MRMQKRKFRIGEFAKTLNVERFVIRFWEKEFNLKTGRSHGGQRFYSEDDLATFIEIKELLYKKGFTIAGAKKQIQLGATLTESAGNEKALDRVLGSKKTELISDVEYQPSHKSETLDCTHTDHQSLSQTYIQELTNQLTNQLTSQLTEQLTTDITAQLTQQLNQQIRQELTEQIKQEMAEQFALEMASKLASQAALFKTEKAELVRQLAELRAHLQKLQALL